MIRPLEVAATEKVTGIGRRVTIGVEGPMGKLAKEFRNYEAEPTGYVREFYRKNHACQTYDFVREKKRQYLTLDRERMTVWEMLEHLNDLVDESDPDTTFTQTDHALQTAEAARHASQPRWMIVTGLIHDLGKVLCKFGEPQWAVVGDTNPVGCRFSPKIVHSEFFALNPDSSHPVYSTAHGVYEPGCGLQHVEMSWGHDEYLYHVVRDRLPVEAQYMIRYHSFYAWHREGEYDWLCDEGDRAMLKWVRAFNRYDLYSKDDARPDAARLRPFYEDLVQEYFPEPLRW
jgi:inositol oxygenase